MPKCEKCDQEEETLYKCSECSAMFCSWCGQTVPPLCIDCSDAEDDEEDEEDWDDEEYTRGVIWMATCGICEETVDKVTTCKTCGEKFCEDCGDQRAKVCTFCEDEGY